MVTEIVQYGEVAGMTPAIGKDGHALSLDEALHEAQALAERRNLARIYVLDRTAGKLEQEALHDHGARGFAQDELDDSDLEDDEKGTDMRDRPHDAGYLK